jgi:hypothetical protein
LVGVESSAKGGVVRLLLLIVATAQRERNE